MDLGYNNTIIKTEYKGHGLKIIDFYVSKGFKDSHQLHGNDHSKYSYYGVKNNNIIYYSPIDNRDLERSGLRIIKLDYKLDYDIWI